MSVSAGLYSLCNRLTVTAQCGTVVGGGGRGVLCFRSLIKTFSIYIRTRSTWKVTAVLCRHVSSQNGVGCRFCRKLEEVVSASSRKVQ